MRDRIVAGVLASLVLAPAAVYAQAQTLTAYWDANPPADQVTGYQVCLGTTSQSCNVAQTTVPASQTSFTFTPNPGVLYYFEVRAVNAVGVGAYSTEVTASIPNLAQPANQTSTVNVAITPLNLSATDPDGGTLQFSHTGLPLGLSLNTSTGRISGTPTAVGTYNVTISVYDGLITVYKSFTWTVGDVTQPSLSITSHTSGQTVSSANVTVSGTATDNGTGGSGITSVTVNGQTATGGAATGNGTANWSRNLTLSTGANVITVVATDGSGNARTTQITLTLSAPSDTTAPALAITSHSSGQTVSSTSVTLSGTATDSGAGNTGVASVTVNGQAATGGSATGSGTANWSRAVTLAVGSNVLTIVATDGAGNARTSQITLNVSLPDTTAPALAITSHTSGQTLSSASITLSGTATDSGAGGSGITSVTVNGQAASGGTASGNATANWSRSLTLASGSNTVTVTARDGAGNARTSQITLTLSVPALPPPPPPGPPPPSGVGIVARDTFAGSSGTMVTAHVPDVSPGTMWIQRQGSTPRLQNGWLAGGSSTGYTLTTLETGAADGTVSVDLLSTGATPFGGVAFRAIDVNRMLLLRYAGNANIGLVGLFRRVNGDFQLIQQVTVSPVGKTVHKLEARFTGNQVQAVWDGAVIFERTVTDYQTATQHGLLWHSDDPLAWFDNFTTTGSGGAPAPNAPPVITGPSDQTHVTGSSVSVAIGATDPEGAALQYGATGLPSGLSVNTSTGVISGTLTASAGTYSVTVSASDGSSTTTRAFTWTVTSPAPAPPPPAPPPPAPGTGVVARDTFTGSNGTTLTAHAPDVSPGTMWVQRQGGVPRLQSGWAMFGSNSGYLIATLETGVSDGTAAVDIVSSSSTLFGGLVLRAVDNNRMLLLRYAGNTNIGLLGLFRRVNGNFELLRQVTTSPIVPGSIHRLEARFSGNQVQAVLDGAVVFSQTVSDYQTATQYGLLWHEDDALARFDNFTVTGTSGGNPPPPNGTPVITGPSNQTSVSGAAISIQIPAADPEGTALQYGASGLPAGLVANAATGVISGTITASAGIYNVTVSASDGNSVATRPFTWTVTAPSPPPGPAPVPAPGIVVRDTFTGANGTVLNSHTPDLSPSASWATWEGMAPRLQNNWLAAGAGFGFGISTLQSGASDGTVGVDIRSGNSAPFAGLVFRAVDVNRMLLLRYAGNGSVGLIGLFRRVNGSFVLARQIAVPPIMPSTTHRLEARLIGTTVQAILDGNIVFAETVTDYLTATQHGLLWHSEDPLVTFDNFTVGP